jgi:hypothetical protein
MAAIVSVIGNQTVNRSPFVRLYTERKLGAAEVTSEFDGFLWAFVQSGFLKRRAPVGMGCKGRHVFERKIARKQIGVANGAVAFRARKRLFGCTVAAGRLSRRVHEWIGKS